MDDYFKLSEQQKQLYVTQNMIGNSNLYVLTFTLLFDGNLDCSCMQKAIQEVFALNKILKCYVIEREGTPLLRVNNSEVRMEYIEDIEGDIEDFVDVENIDLKSDVLYRIKLIKRSNHLHLLQVSIHHILVDGDSIRLFCESLRKIYNENLKIVRQKKRLPMQIGLSDSYFNYIIYQDIFRKSNYYRMQKQYFQSQFTQQYEYLKLPGKEVENGITYKADIECTMFDISYFLKLQNYALANRIQISSIFLSGLALLLRSYCVSDDIVVGCISSGRENNILFKNMIGFFSNIVPLRIKLKKKMRLNEFIAYVDKKFVEGVANQDYSYGDIVHNANNCQKHINNSLIQVIFNVQKTYEIVHQWTGINKVSLQLNRNERILYGLIVNIEYSNTEVIIKIEYANELFSRSLINRFINNYQYIMENVISNLNLQLSCISTISPNEQERILDQFNQTDEKVREKNIFDLLHRSTKCYFDKLAIVDNEMQLTYGELKKYTDSLATLLLNNQIDKEIIGILLDRSSLYVISLLSILSINAAFMPIDPNIPNEYKIKMLRDCSVRRILTSQRYRSIVEDLQNNVKDISVLYVDHIEVKNVDFQVPAILPQDLAYVLFTSGTSGEPKGAMISHGNMVNLYYLFRKFLKINCKNKILQFANISFDASVWDIFMALYHGATLYIPTKYTVLDMNEICQYIDEHLIDTVTLPPIYARQLEDCNLKTIKNLIVAGSISYQEDYEKLKQNKNFYNAYGLTETTICVTVYDVNNGVCDVNKNELPVGRPAPNTKIFILDNWNKISPIGVTGALFVSGKCLSSGYINNEKLTKERYFLSEYSNGDIMYHTGDMAFWSSDGNIILTGRSDEQVKIRGIRVELPAIENVYLRHENISAFAVIAVANNNDYLLKAFYRANSKLTEDELIEYGNLKLPEYMIPHTFTELPQLPISNSGKIDKKQLMNIDTVKRGDSNKKDVIGSEIYNMIVSLTERNFDWDDNFFEAGLDSFRLLIFKNKLQKRFDVDIRTAELFKYTTVNSLSKYLKNRLR